MYALLFFSCERPMALSSNAEPRAAERDSQPPADSCYDHSVLHAPLAQLAEQQTLNLRVRGSSPWRRTHSELELCLFRFPCEGRFWPVVAPRLLVSPDLVARR